MSLHIVIRSWFVFGLVATGQLLAAEKPEGDDSAVGILTIGDFSATDQHGGGFRLSDCRASVIAVVFLGVDCPLAKLSAPVLNDIEKTYSQRGVQVIAINSNRHESFSRVAEFAQQAKSSVLFLKDEGNQIADQFGATRSPEVFVLDTTRSIRYHGRIDDQRAPGTDRQQPTRRDLVEAIEDLLAGRSVRVPETEAKGCFIDREEAIVSGPINYVEHVAPILQEHCVNCHRAGQIAPFSLTTYDEAQAWAKTIREVVSQRQMPPWNADPRFGHFANERKFTHRERKMLIEWCDSGAALGDIHARRVEEREDNATTSARGNSSWEIGTPDCIVQIPVEQHIPATGTVEYQYVDVEPQFDRDRWVAAVEIQPTNRATLHHCTIFLSPPGAQGTLVEQGSLGSYCLATYTPGTSPSIFPPGMAKLVPVGWHFVFVLHYITNGTVQTDQTRMALRFVEAGEVRQEVATKLLHDDALIIQPGESDHIIEKSFSFEQDVRLLSFFPHMHLRGRSFRYDAIFADGSVETLLHVPQYDFHWQHRYTLSDPRFLPAGTTLRCTARYDNTTKNPNNPDAAATVHAGKLTTDEMFNGYFDFVLANEDRSLAGGKWPLLGQGLIEVGLAGLAAIGVYVVRRTSRHPPSASAKSFHSFG